MQMNPEYYRKVEPTFRCRPDLILMILAGHEQLSMNLKGTLKNVSTLRRYLVRKTMYSIFLGFGPPVQVSGQFRARFRATVDFGPRSRMDLDHRL